VLTSHVSNRLAAYVDGEVTPNDVRTIERHLAECARCRTDHQQLRLAAATLKALPMVPVPDNIWPLIERGLREASPTVPPVRPRVWRWAAAGAMAVVIAVVAIGRWGTATRWEVRVLEGSPVVASRVLTDGGQVGAGDWIETDARARATIDVGAIGTVEIAPDSRVRVTATRANEHRLTLERGRIHAVISAPPRIFFVDTASATAVDLGCEYTLNADEAGDGVLRVTRGWVSFQTDGLESLVPAGAACATHRRVGPGLPYFEDATDSFRQAVNDFGFQKIASESLNTMLAEARARDTLTLWHLLTRVSEADRARVYDRMAALTAVPPAVSRESVLKLDPRTLQRWREELAWTW